LSLNRSLPGVRQQRRSAEEIAIRNLIDELAKDLLDPDEQKRRRSELMADSRYWRRPGRREEERASFNRLMRELERFRLREGLTKRELARRLDTSEDAIHYWLSGRTIGRIIDTLAEQLPEP